MAMDRTTKLRWALALVLFGGAFARAEAPALLPGVGLQRETRAFAPRTPRYHGSMRAPLVASVEVVSGACLASPVRPLNLVLRNGDEERQTDPVPENPNVALVHLRVPEGREFRILLPESVIAHPVLPAAAQLTGGEPFGAESIAVKNFTAHVVNASPAASGEAGAIDVYVGGRSGTVNVLTGDRFRGTGTLTVIMY